MTHRKLQPSGEHILIRYADALRANRADSNATRQNTPSAARIIAVGPGRQCTDGSMIPLGLKVGERIYVDRARGVRIRLNRQSYVVIRKDDLVGLR